MCTEWHSALGSLSGNYFTDGEFSISPFFENNLPSLLPRVVFVLVGVFFGGGRGGGLVGFFAALLIIKQGTSIGHIR